MKKILITGANSYIGTSFEKWVLQYPEKYSVDTIDMKEETWREKSFKGYDVVFHVAGIAHVSSNPRMKDLYYKVNRDLTIEAAKKAKAEGVKQFIFMSSIIVYGDSSIGRKIIDKNTLPNPSNFYGDSKLQAEKGIKSLESDSFKIVILRPPMIYGKGSKGNYPKLSKVARMLPIFPDFDNQRSMLHIDNLCEFVRHIIDNEESGLFFPQNREYVKTSEMVKLIAEVYGKKVRLTKLFNPIIILAARKFKLINKLFGNLAYEQSISKYKKDYQIRDLKNSIKLTENNFYNNIKLDILLMCDNGLETVGGEQESTKIIIQGLKDMFLIGVIQPGEIKNPFLGVKYYHLTFYTRIKHLIKHPISIIKYILGVKSIINQSDPKIIHTQAQISFFIVALLRKIKLISKDIKIIHTERGLYTKYNWFIKQIFYFCMSELNILVTTTKFNMDYWKTEIQSRGLTLDFKIIENTAGPLFELYDEKRAKQNLDTDTIVIGFAGRYCDWKNWPLAIEICSKLNEILGEKLYVKMAVGCLDKNSLKETKAMFNYLYGLLGKRFEGKINADIKYMDEFYYDIDVFILTSKYNTESFGRTLVEAMSRKTVVLTTNSGGSVEVVGDNKNVCNTTNEFVERILYFYNNRHFMEIEKETNYMRVKERYSLKNNIDKHVNMYKEILAKRGV